MTVVEYSPTSMCPIQHCNLPLKNHKEVVITKCCQQIVGALCIDNASESCPLCNNIRRITKVATKDLYLYLKNHPAPQVGPFLNRISNLHKTYEGSLITPTFDIGLLMLHSITANTCIERVQLPLKIFLTFIQIWPHITNYMAFEDLYEWKNLSFSSWDSTNRKTQLLWHGTLIHIDLIALTLLKTLSLSSNGNSREELGFLILRICLVMKIAYHHHIAMSPEYAQAWGYENE